MPEDIIEKTEEIAEIEKTEEQKPSVKNLVFLLLKIFGAFIVFLILAFVVPKPNFNGETTILINSGDGVKSAGDKLYDAGIIWSSTLFDLETIIIGKNKVIAGPYKFGISENIIGASIRLTHGYFGVQKIKTTFPEGFTATDMANRLFSVIPNFNKNLFLTSAKPLEGYLFPDTYFFLPGVTEADIIDKLQKTFKEKNPKLFLLSKETQIKIITLASIIEKEVQKPEDKKTVAEIFVKRLNTGMALQSDATIAYILDEDSKDVTALDLKKDSPYNTYIYKGLPPTPITNPGLDAINSAYDAILNPQGTTYLYFLTDKDGNVHYATTYAEHKANVAKYLR
ncbi:MAG: endolytic transglycosylase MltG [Candidatus Paceibacterota bacterium]